MLAGCVVYERPARQPNGTVDYNPPAAQYEAVPPAPGPLNVWVWIPGQWEWRRGSWKWDHGRWAVRPHPGAVWVRGGWVWRGHHLAWVHGYWGD